MYARFGHFEFNSARFNENGNDSDNYQRVDYFPIGEDTTDFVSPAPPTPTFEAHDAPDSPPYIEVEG